MTPSAVLTGSEHLIFAFLQRLHRVHLGRIACRYPSGDEAADYANCEREHQQPCIGREFLGPLRNAIQFPEYLAQVSRDGPRHQHAARDSERGSE